ncbi:MAG TPA: hypothetical protein VF622_17470 [Segetibacter sp.]|jgi:hypothetical protein
MKKIILSFVFVVASVGMVSAQQTDSDKKESLKKQLKTEFKLSEFEADSLVKIQFNFEAYSRELNSNSTLSAAEKKEKLDKQLWMRRERMKILVKQSELDKVQAFYDKIKG